MKKLITILILISTMMITLTSAYDGSTVIDQDTYTSQVSGSSNYGTQDRISVRSRTPGYNMRGYFYINMSDNACGGNYSDVQVNLTHYYNTYTDNNSVEFVMYYCDNPFSETAITWNNQDTYMTNCSGSSFLNMGYVESFAINTTYYYNITDVANNDSDQLWTLRLLSDPESYSSDAHIIRFHSSDSTIPEYQPSISYTCESEPCTPDWVCSGYGGCNTSDLAPCNTTIDNNGCGQAYSGDYSEFPAQACDYCSYSLNLVSLGVCDSDTGYRTDTYEDLNFATCCNVTSLPSDCAFGSNSTGGVNVSCTGNYISSYATSDLQEVAIDGLVMFGIGIVSLAGIIGLVFVFKFARVRLK